jgi:acetoin utilization protein AcuB
MIAIDLISELILPLKTSDTGETTLQLMYDYSVKHLPIVNNQQFLGLVSENDILDQDLSDQPIGSMQLTYYKPCVEANMHIFDVLKIASKLKLTVIPVIDANNNYKGLITLDTLLFEFSRKGAITDPGGIIELEVLVRDYSLAEISRIVESNNARILCLYTNLHTDSTRVEITLKINKEDISSIIATFERYDYKVSGYFQKSDMDDDLLQRYQSLIKYLNI